MDTDHNISERFQVKNPFLDVEAQHSDASDSESDDWTLRSMSIHKWDLQANQTCSGKSHTAENANNISSSLPLMQEAAQGPEADVNSDERINAFLDRVRTRAALWAAATRLDEKGGLSETEEVGPAEGSAVGKIGSRVSNNGHYQTRTI